MRKVGEYDSSYWYDDQVSFMQDLESPRRISHPNYTSYHQHNPCKAELELQYNVPPHDPNFLQLPQLESPKVSQSVAPYGFDSNNNNGSSTLQFSSLNQEEQTHYCHQKNSLHNSIYGGNDQAVDQVTDWRVLDKFVASQLSHDQHNVSNATIIHVAEQITMLANGSKREQISQEYASTSTSSGGQVDLWK